MRNIILSLSTIGLLYSCGGAAEKIELESKTFSNPLRANFNSKGSGFDTTVRGITLISYPNESEIVDFDYKVNANTFSKLFDSPAYTLVSVDNDIFVNTQRSLIDYGSRMSNGVEGNLSPAKKVQSLVKQVVNVGDVRDKAYEAYIINEENIKDQRQRVNIVESQLEANLNFWKIKGTPAGQESFKNKYTLSKVDGYDYARKNYNTKDCDQFLKRRYKKVATDLLTSDELNLLNTQKSDCLGVKSVKKSLSKVDEIQEGLIFDGKNISSSSIFYAGKSYITEILDELERVSGKDFLFTGIAKESVLDGTFSKDQARQNITEIKFNDDITDYEKFSLVLELTSEGPKVYSVENGLINNLRIVETQPGVKVTMFEIIGGDINVSLELGMTNMRRFGVRLIGDAFFTFADGSTNRGVMKIEIDSNADINFPFEL